MRISDWSSDVCASDLGRIHPIISFTLIWLFSAMTGGWDSPMIAFLWGSIITAVTRSHSFLADRKSVVSGQSVSVRVDLGGRRLMIKKTKCQCNNPDVQIHTESIITI